MNALLQKDIERLGFKVRLHDGRLQVAEIVPGSKERHGEQIVALADSLLRELAIEEGSFPRIDANGNLIIPRTAPRRYRWWDDGGQRISETLAELHASREIWARYTDEPYPFEKRDVIDGSGRMEERPNEN